MNALRIHPADDVAVAAREIARGEEVTFEGGGPIAALDAIPIYHKIALRDIAKGEPVRKYGEIIGVATADIRCGEYVHTHNLGD